MATVTVELVLCGKHVPGGRIAGQDADEVLNNSVSPNVLVVDDEKLVADSIARILTQRGCKVTALYHPAQAASFVRENCPDILLTDVLMPGMNGIELAVLVQQECSRTRVILFSGQAATGDLLHEARALGLDFELLPKPLHPTQLVDKVMRGGNREQT